MMDAVVESGPRQQQGASTRAKTNVTFSGLSPETIALQQEIERVARSDAKVLITGESGVGKEIVARNTHARPGASHGRAGHGRAGQRRCSSPSSAAVKGALRAYRASRASSKRPNGPIFLTKWARGRCECQGLLLRV